MAKKNNDTKFMVPKNLNTSNPQNYFHSGDIYESNK